MPYIEIAGVMGTGKTSLAKVFNEKAGYAAIFEKDEHLERLFFVEPYLSDPQKYAFVGALNFTAFHTTRILEELAEIQQKTDRIVVDTSLLMQIAYTKDFATEREIKAVTENVCLSYETLPKVDLRIVTELPIETHMKRLAARGRETEKGVSRAFLETTQKAIHTAIHAMGDSVPVVFLDSSKIDGVNSEVGKKEALRIVNEALLKQGKSL